MIRLKKIPKSFPVLLLAVVCLAGLISGFVPGLVHREVRRALTEDVPQQPSESRQATRPMSHIVWSMRGVLQAEAPQLTLFDSNVTSEDTSSAGALSLPAVPTVHSALWSYVNPSDILPRPAFKTDGAETADAEVLDENGYLLRWSAEKRACEVAPEAQGDLFALINQWERSQEQYSRTLQARASRYKQAVEVWSRRFSLRADLVYAIMYVESSFNPTLVSGRSAHGLMQVVPHTAGGAVRAWLGEDGQPTQSELFEPYQNIKYGAGYLRLLLNRHFGSIKDSLAREYCAIASYNSGSGPVLRVFGQTREAALETINTLNADEVLNKLLTHLPARETRNFVRKVLATQRHFVAMR